LSPYPKKILGVALRPARDPVEIRRVILGFLHFCEDRMAQDGSHMLFVALASFLTGAVLGLRFRVSVLVPTLAVAFVAIGVPALIEHGVLTAAWWVGAGLASLQLGYVAGIITRFVIAATRSPRPPSGSLQRPAHQWPVRQGVSKVR
jgi:hypothetical protein